MVGFMHGNSQHRSDRDSCFTCFESFFDGLTVNRVYSVLDPSCQNAGVTISKFIEKSINFQGMESKHTSPVSSLSNAFTWWKKNWFFNSYDFATSSPLNIFFAFSVLGNIHKIGLFPSCMAIVSANAHLANMYSVINF